MKTEYKAHMALFIAGLIFGANYWIAKGLMPDYLLPLQIIFIRILVAALLFWAFHFMFRSKEVEKKDLIRIAIASLFGISINQVFFFKGLFYTTPVDTSIIHASSPLLVLVFAGILIKEKITPMKLVGIILGGLGTILLVAVGKEISFNSNTFKGDVFILINITAYSLYLVLIKPVMIKYKPVTVMKWVFLFGFIFVLPFTLGTIDDIVWSNMNFYSWFALGYVVLGTTFLTYLLTIYGLKNLNASIVGFYIYMQPLVAAFIGIVIFNEGITIIKIISALLIFIGVYFVNRRKRETKTRFKKSA